MSEPCTENPAQPGSSPNKRHFMELVTGSGAAFLVRVLGLFAGYGFTYVVATQYGTEAYGHFSLLVTLLVLLAVCSTLGFETAVIKFVATNRTLGHYGNIGQMYRKVTILTLCASTIGAIALYLLAPCIAAVFPQPNVENAVPLVALALPVLALRNVNVGILKGLKRPALAEFLKVVATPLFGIAIVFAVHRSETHGPLIAHILGLAVSALISGLCIWALVPGAGNRRSDSNGKGDSLNTLLRVSSPMMLTALMHILMGKTDILMLGRYSTSHQLAVYSIAFKIAGLSSLTLAAVSAIAAPKFAELYALKKSQDLARIVRTCSMILFWTTCPLVVAMILVPDLLMGLFGLELRGNPGVLVCLALGQLTNACVGPVGYLLSMTGKEREFRNVVLLALCMNVSLNRLLIPEFGAQGAAVTTLVTMVVWNLASMRRVWLAHGFITLYIPWFLPGKEAAK